MNQRCLIVGGGTMGSGIALVAARGGYGVEIVEPLVVARERALAYFERETQRSNDAAVLDRITWLDAIPQSSDATLAIEAVPERFDLKREVFIALAHAIAPDALLATNTSSLSVSALADVVECSDRVVGLHFFNPPARMALLEIICAPQTSDEILERAFAVAATLGKTAVLASDTPGFIVNRVARPFYLQAMRALQAELASVQELDALARGAGFRMGPFELMDLIGLDVNLATTESLYARTGAQRFAPVELQQRMVAQELLGRKTGAGFYDYRNGLPERYEADASPQPESNSDEFVALLGFGPRADELAELLEQRYANVQRIENDELIDELSLKTTMMIDAGDGVADRGEIVAGLDSVLGAESVFFVDAYATDLQRCARRMQHPDRLVGYGVLGALESQHTVEIVDSDEVSDEALELAQELFASLRKGTVLVEDSPALFLGRTVGSIVNEAMIAVAENVASPDDIDTAMRLGANYPIGPVAWGREIGGARVARILKRLADAEGDAFAPHRSLWMLDVAPNQDAEEPVE